VPFLLRVPPRLGERRGVVTDAPVGLQDVMPTLLDAAGAPLPDTMTGRSLLPFVREERPAWRDALHGEHAGCYRYDDGAHFLVEERFKYVWYSQSGREHLFDLRADPIEHHDLSGATAGGSESDAREHLERLRRRLVQQLRDRPEGFVDGDRLVPGRPHRELVPR
jgi:arylsulfatase A-like enzyme